MISICLQVNLLGGVEILEQGNDHIIPGGVASVALEVPTAVHRGHILCYVKDTLGRVLKEIRIGKAGGRSESAALVQSEILGKQVDRGSAVSVQVISGCGSSYQVAGILEGKLEAVIHSLSLCCEKCLHILSGYKSGPQDLVGHGPVKLPGSDLIKQFLSYVGLVDRCKTGSVLVLADIPLVVRSGVLEIYVDLLQDTAIVKGLFNERIQSGRTVCSHRDDSTPDTVHKDLNKGVLVAGAGKYLVSE